MPQKSCLKEEGSSPNSASKTWDSRARGGRIRVRLLDGVYDRGGRLGDKIDPCLLLAAEASVVERFLGDKLLERLLGADQVDSFPLSQEVQAARRGL